MEGRNGEGLGYIHVGFSAMMRAHDDVPQHHDEVASRRRTGREKQTAAEAWVGGVFCFFLNPNMNLVAWHVDHVQ